MRLHALGGRRQVVFAAAGLIGLRWVAPESACAAPPRPDHLVVVVEENHSYNEILGASSPATYIKSLASMGASFTKSFGVEHPSQPNYLDLFSGANQGTTGTDAYPTGTPFTATNLGGQLRAAGLSFGGYSQSLPSIGSTVDTSGYYRHKHNPWANWQAASPTANQLPPGTNMPFTSFPTDFTKLPTVSFVAPDQLNDMHDGTIAQADDWLKANLDRYYEWAQFHNSLLIVTTDEDDGTQSNQIATIFAGPMIKRAQYSQTINHYSVLRTIEDMYGLPHIGAAASATTITGAFYSQPRAWLGGDTNFDGTVNSGDFAVLASNFNGSNKSWTTGDFNGDGRVNALDFNALASGFGQTSAVPPTALGTLIPEPGCCAALLAVLVGRRCRRSSRDNSSSSGLGFEGGTSRRFVDRR